MRKHKETEEKLRDYIINSSEGIWAYDLEPPIPLDLPVDDQLDLMYERAYISEANDAIAHMFGYEKGDNMLGLPLDNFQPRENPQNVAFVKNVICKKYNVIDFETTAFGAGGVMTVLISNIQGVIEDGKLLRIWGTSRDVTEQYRLKKELEIKKRDLHKLAGRLILNQEKELSRLARELHDDLTQQLAVTAIEAGTLEKERGLPEHVKQKLSQIKEQLIKISKVVHNISRDLHPSILNDLGLERALRSECNNFSSRTGIAVIFNPKNVSDKISKDKALTAYRIIQEGLSNIDKHADSKNAYVFLESSDGKLIFSVCDSGRGFDPSNVREKAALGLGSIRERVRLVNGKSSITSSPGKGTTIEVSIPLKEN